MAGAIPASPTLEFPGDEVAPARNRRPVILLHGTLVKKEGIEAYRDYALELGHPVDHRDYPSITEGDRIEESAATASRQINRARVEIARQNLTELMGSDRAELGQFFELDPNLYGAHDAGVESVLDVLPGLTQKFEKLLGQEEATLDESFSGQVKAVQDELTQELEGRGVERSGKVAAELIDTLAPKSIVIGHSAGGFVGYTLALNPETTPDDDPFTFDGGNGVGELLILSSPVGKGMSVPAPPGIAEMPFYIYESNVLEPLEELPASKLARLNPVVDLSYRSGKAMLEWASEVGTLASVAMTSPLVFLMKPGYEQVREGSDFLEEHVEGRQVPDGVTVIAVTSPLDKMSLEERSRLEDDQENTHNFSVDLKLSQEELERERPTWSHVKMTENPFSFKNQLADELVEKPESLKSLMHPSNDDGVRYEALQMVAGELQGNGSLATPELRRTLEDVAAERLPFRDSPSNLAGELLKKHFNQA